MTETMERLERDFFSIEQSADGQRRVHVYAYAYDSGDNTETPFRLVQFTFMYISIPSEMSFQEAYEAAYNTSTQYISYYRYDDLIDVLDNYFPESPVELAYEEITPDTPCGFYIQP